MNRAAASPAAVPVPEEVPTGASPGEVPLGTSPVEGRRSRRRRELHQSILETAAELFARDGYDATTVEKIAHAADIVPATFFNHFRSKEDVLREVGQDVFSRFRRLVDEQLARPVGSVERLHGFAERSAHLVRRAPEMTRRVLMAVLRSSRPGESGAELRQMQADFAELLRRGRDDGALGRDEGALGGDDGALGGNEGAPGGDVPADLDIELTAEILVSVVIGAMTHWINDPSYPLERKLRASLSLLADRLLRSGGTPPETAARPRARTAKPPRTPPANGNGSRKTATNTRTTPKNATPPGSAGTRRKTR